MRETVSRKKDRIDTAISRTYTDRRTACGALYQRLDALSPLAVLKRGYSAVMDCDGRVVGRASDMKAGDAVTIVMADGSAKAEVLSIHNDSNGGS